MDHDIAMLVLIEAAEKGPDALQAAKDYLAAHPDEVAETSSEPESN